MFSPVPICGHCAYRIDPSQVLGDSYETTLNDLEAFLPSTASIPPGESMARLRSFLGGLEESKRILDQEIEALESSLDRLKKTRQRLADVYDRQHSIVAPIRRLPTEILPLIFHEFSPVTALRPRDFARVWRERTVLMLVCRIWLQTSVSVPSLWNTLNFIAISRGPRPNSFPRLLHMWLTRAGDMPLEIMLGPSFYERCGNEALYEVLLPFRKRWQIATITPYLYDLKQSLETPYHGELQLLEKLILVPGHSRHESAESMALFPLVLTSPLLKSLEIHDNIYSDFSLPIYQITNLELRNVRAFWEDTKDLLRSAVHLESLEITYGMLLKDRPFQIPLEGINMPRLNKWTIRLPCLGEGDDSDLLIRTFITPSLYQFCLICTVTRDEAALDNIAAFFRRSRCRLKTLVLHSQRAADSNIDIDILPVIRAVPTITSLTIDLPSVPTLWNALCVGAEDGEITSPHLMVLRIWFRRHKSAYYEELLDAIRTRRATKGVQRIRKLTLLSNESLAELFQGEYCRALEEEGVSLSIKFPRA